MITGVGGGWLNAGVTINTRVSQPQVSPYRLLGRAVEIPNLFSVGGGYTIQSICLTN